MTIKKLEREREREEGRERERERERERRERERVNVFKNERVFLVEVDQQVHYSWCFILHGNFPRVQTMINEQVPWNYHFMHIINVHVWVLGVSLPPLLFVSAPECRDFVLALVRRRRRRPH